MFKGCMCKHWSNSFSLTTQDLCTVSEDHIVIYCFMFVADSNEVLSLLRERIVMNSFRSLLSSCQTGIDRMLLHTILCAEDSSEIFLLCFS